MTKDKRLTIHQPDALSLVDEQFLYATTATMRTVAESSARVYADTFKQWHSWAYLNGIDPLAVNGGNVWAFLTSREVSQTSRQRMLSALRALARVLVVLDAGNPARQAAYQSVEMTKAPKGKFGVERSRRALTPDEVNRVFDVWLDDDLLSVRNQALITTLFSSGVRRAELIALKWMDIDLDEGVLHIRHGKGDKERHAALFGDESIRALDHWQNAQGEGREFAFCPLTNNAIGTDEPMTADNLYKIVQATAIKAGVAFKPHDARRTLATELLAMGMPTSEVQAQLGHANASTTLRYVLAGAAAKRRQSVVLRWGG